MDISNKIALGSLASIAVAAFGVAALAQGTEGGPEASVRAALAERLPKTEVTQIDCSSIGGLCEVQAGSNLFYVDSDARFLVIGRVYDMEEKRDLTAERLLDMNPNMLLGGAAGASEQDEEVATASAPRAARVDIQSLAALPGSGAVEYGSGKNQVTVFSDFNCGYCRQLHEELKKMDVKVVERPISVLGTRELSERVVCASNAERALNKAYTGADLGIAPEGCDTTGLDANERFARENGFTGTPVIVSADGRVLHGYRPASFLEGWIKAEEGE